MYIETQQSIIKNAKKTISTILKDLNPFMLLNLLFLALKDRDLTTLEFWYFIDLKVDAETKIKNLQYN